MKTKKDFYNLLTSIDSNIEHHQIERNPIEAVKDVIVFAFLNKLESNKLEQLRNEVLFYISNGYMWEHQYYYEFSYDDIDPLEGGVELYLEGYNYYFLTDFLETVIDGNCNQILELLKLNRTIDVSKVGYDSESNGLWIYFKNREDGNEFIDKLNTYLKTFIPKDVYNEYKKIYF